MRYFPRPHWTEDGFKVVFLFALEGINLALEEKPYQP